MNYLHPTHGELFVARGLGGLYMTVYRVKSGAFRRLKSPFMPAVHDQATAQANLDAWAKLSKLEAVSCR